MPTFQLSFRSGARAADPVVRMIGLDDLRDAVAKGIDDFRAMPTHVIFLAVIYPLVGLFLARMTFGYDVLPILFPLVAGFALIGPFAAVGLYELSRRREQGIDVGWEHAFGLLQSPSLDGIAVVGIVLMGLFLAWLACAMWLYQALFGTASPDSLGQFLADIATTPRGWILVVAGHAIGFLFAALVLTIGAVSFPLLLDRDVGPLVAMRTSARVVLRNPLVMAAWGLFVAAALIVGSLTLFVGLAIIMPVLAHASWHLYRKAVEA
jgi:uncharacterized membrane protein